MSKILLFTFLFAAALAGSSFTNAHKKHAVVVRDCSGTYLRINGSDYRVCNQSILTDVNDGETVSVTFKKVKKCPPTDEIVCMLYHDHKGSIEITKVQWRAGKVEYKK